jgi:hypothetical protein
MRYTNVPLELKAQVRSPQMNKSLRELIAGLFCHNISDEIDWSEGWDNWSDWNKHKYEAFEKADSILSLLASYIKSVKMSDDEMTKALDCIPFADLRSQQARDVLVSAFQSKLIKGIGERR